MKPKEGPTRKEIIAVLESRSRDELLELAEDILGITRRIREKNPRIYLDKKPAPKKWL